MSVGSAADVPITQEIYLPVNNLTLTYKGTVYFTKLKTHPTSITLNVENSSSTLPASIDGKVTVMESKGSVVINVESQIIIELAQTYAHITHSEIKTIAKTDFEPSNILDTQASEMIDNITLRIGE